MSPSSPISTIFSDIGGVLLTNGWDHRMRQQAAEKFGLEYGVLNDRHKMTFDTYEEGKLSLDEYLDRVVFHEQRPFPRQEFKDFMLAQSRRLPDMIELLQDLKTQYGLKVVAVSNEGRELTEYRVQKFALKSLIDVFVSSCFVHFRKPDHDIFRLALDVAQVAPQDVVYIDDRPLFVQVAQDLGIRGIVHSDVASTRDALAECGLVGRSGS